MKNKKVFGLFCGILFLLTTSFVFAESNPIPFANPVGTKNVSEFVGTILSNLSGVIGSVALLFVVIGGVMYMISAGEEKKMETAKNIITSALIGLAIVLAAPTFLRELLKIFGGANMNPGSVGQAATAVQIVSKILNFLLSIVGTIAIIGMVSGGLIYLTSAGEKDRAEKGKKILFAAIIGISICLSSLVIIRTIEKFF